MGQWLVTIRKRVLGHHREAPEDGSPRAYDLQEPETLVINMHPAAYVRQEREAGYEIVVLLAMPADTSAEES